MELNFFQWLRGAIRQTVLLGVSDAVKQLGTVEESEEVHPQIAGLLAGGAVADDAAGKSKTTRTRNSTPRKRLGKSLKEIGDLEEPKRTPRRRVG